MRLHTVTVFDSGRYTNSYHGWDFAQLNVYNEFHINDMDGRPRFFEIQSLQSPQGNMKSTIYEGFYRKDRSAIVTDKRPEVNKDSVLVALVVDGYINIDQIYFKKRMIKSAVLRNGNMALIVVHMRKNETVNFDVKIGERIVRSLSLSYHDSKGIIISGFVKDKDKKVNLLPTNPDSTKKPKQNRLMNAIKTLMPW